jgi:hypothetical protein
MEIFAPETADYAMNAASDAKRENTRLQARVDVLEVKVRELHQQLLDLRANFVASLNNRPE